MPDIDKIWCLVYRVACTLVSVALAACTMPTPVTTSQRPAVGTSAQASLVPAAALLDRVTGGADQASLQRLAMLGTERFLDQQLNAPTSAPLPIEVQAQIDALTISQQPMERLVIDLEQRRRDIVTMAGDEAKRAAQRAYQQELTRLGREAMTRSLLRAVYSPHQLREQMTWFWMNHFNVFQFKNNVRAMIGDFEERAIRPNALGRFRDLLAATVYHPAMLRYLDNDNNAAGRINENYARELMELHTLGVDGGYTQQDVQELARILTGVGINLTERTPNVRRDLAAHYQRDGLFEFNPNRHDFGDKRFLGATVQGRGLAEVNEIIDKLGTHPSTARFVSRKLAVYFVADNAPQALVERMAATFTRTDGDIAATLSTMFRSTEFAASLGQKFKDPRNYVVSAMRLAYSEKPIENVNPMINWLARLGQPLYGRQTPDGYSMQEASWSSSGQMATRFEIARAIGNGSPVLFAANGVVPTQRGEPPRLADSAYYAAVQQQLSPATRRALDSALSTQEWNAYFLSSPEFMHR